MDSPVRQQQKRNDYLRHKLFRKINRRRRAKRQQDIEAPVKELKKRLRQKRTFEDGKDGDISDQQYYSIMERVAKENNPIWNEDRRRNGQQLLSVDEDFLRILNDNSYDYRGYYNKYQNSRANADTHWTDEFKTVYHPTFSVYSKYSGKKSQYNPEGVLGGQWNDDQYIPAWGQILPTYADGKDSGIYIKPENRGKFTRLKKRTGHSTAWFKAHGTPAQKKMAVFAMNSKRWHH